MRTRSRRMAGLAGAAALLASLSFASSAEAARRAGHRPTAAASVRTLGEAGDAASESWLGRAYSWLQAIFGADNGGIVP